MPLVIPNLESTPLFDAQAIPDATDWTATGNSEDGTGVVSGCLVTPHSGADMNVSIAAGYVVIAGVPVQVAAVTSLAIGAASTTDRKDIVVVNSSGTVSVTAGTPCGIAGWSRVSIQLPPVKPAIPSNSTMLAEVYVAATTTVIATGNIIDKTTLTTPLAHAVSRTASATVAAGEGTVFTGTTATQTLTLPATPLNGTTNRVTNYSTHTVVIAAGGADTLNTFLTTGSHTVAIGEAVAYVYVTSTTTWYCIDTNSPTFIPANTGTAGQLLVVNPGATALEFKTLAVGTPATAAQEAATMTASSANIVSGSLIQLPTADLFVASRFKWTIGLGKTAAGVATWKVDVKFGTAGTTADATIATFTSGTNTGIIDHGLLIVSMNVLTIGGTATANCLAFYQHQPGVDATGLGLLPAVPGSTATFNAAATTPFLHIDITPGASAVMTAWCETERLA